MEEEVVMEDNSPKGGKVKKTIITVLIIVVIIAVIVGVVNLIRPTPAKTVKKAIKSLNKGNISEVMDLVDYQGLTAYYSTSDDLEDFYDEYKDLSDDDDFQDDLEDFNEELDENVEDLEETISDFDKFSFELKEIKSSKKVSKAKNLYKVRAKVKYTIQSDDEDIDLKDTATIDFYVMKKSGKYYIVGIDGASSLTSLMKYAY